MGQHADDDNNYEQDWIGDISLGPDTRVFRLSHQTKRGDYTDIIVRPGQYMEMGPQVQQYYVHEVKAGSGPRIALVTRKVKPISISEVGLPYDYDMVLEEGSWDIISTKVIQSILETKAKAIELRRLRNCAKYFGPPVSVKPRDIFEGYSHILESHIHGNKRGMLVDQLLVG